MVKPSRRIPLTCGSMLPLAISRFFILLQHLRVKLILTRETRRKCWELELFAGATICFGTTKHFERKILRLKSSFVPWRGLQV